MPAKKNAAPPSKKELSPVKTPSRQGTVPAQSRAGSSKRKDSGYRATTVLTRKKLYSAAQHKLAGEDNGEDMSDLWNRLLFRYVTGDIKELLSSPGDYTELGF